MRRWFQFPLKQGQASSQAHCNLPENSYERECGRDGFFGPASHMYHRHMPTGWTQWQGPHRPKAFDTFKLDLTADSVWDAPILLQNAALKLRFWQCNQAMPYLARNGDGDEMLFIHQGRGDLFCDYGHLSYQEGDYLLIPRGTNWRIEPQNTTLLMLIEATRDSYQLPDRGLVGQHAIFDPGVLVPAAINSTFIAQQDDHQVWQVKLKARDQINVITYPYNPLDAVGWKGEVTALKLNWRDIRPLMSHRYHLPPSAHSTFVCRDFVICTFVPRPIEQDPDALKVPFFHNNDDYDEVIFYHQGNFFSRDNIDAGMVTFHPCGFTHGPHPKAYQHQGEKAATDEVAVMIDSRVPFDVTDAATKVENTSYWASWQSGATKPE
ncbi:homogentisate 1,2-dioxygenase [Thaumasiovibrio subtropicus]|uniref:homogentisate 1,2-dioxygenase n=1 Tax=Thaumasiovibrio subtropicus TaxID=1891207 RepID=UPI000B35F6D6|nr:homogentisate 1,2-dioxygenase [Thaumasiovibrio subtropicus]